MDDKGKLNKAGKLTDFALEQGNLRFRANTGGAIITRADFRDHKPAWNDNINYIVYRKKRKGKHFFPKQYIPLTTIYIFSYLSIDEHIVHKEIKIFFLFITFVFGISMNGLETHN